MEQDHASNQGNNFPQNNDDFSSCTIADVMKLLTGLKQDIHGLKGEVDTVKTKFSNFDVNLRTWCGAKEEEITELKRVNKDQDDRIVALENNTRRRNIVIIGLPESSENEEEKELERQVVNFLSNDAKVDRADEMQIESVKRLKGGKKGKRPIIVEFLSYKDKSRALYTAKENMKNRNDIWIKNDVCNKWKATRKQLARFYADARKKGLEVKVVQDFLMVNNERYNYDPKTNDIYKVEKTDTAEKNMSK